MDFEVCSVVRNHMKLFHVLGFCTISLGPRHTRKKVENILLTWSTISALLVIAVTLAIFIYKNNILFIGDNFGEFNDIAKFLCVSFAYEVSLIEAIVSRKHDCYFWTKYSHLQKKKPPKFKENPFKRYRYFFWSFYGYIAIKIVFEITFAVAIRHRDQWLMNWFIFTPCALITGLKTLQIILYMELIRAEVEELNLGLISLRRRCKRLSGAALGREFKKVSQLMETYQLIYEMSEHFKGSSGLSMGGNFIKSYTLILGNFYWTFWIVYHEDELIEYLLLIIAMIEMVVPLVISRNCMRVAKYTSYHVHRLRHPIESYRFSVLIENFSLQVFHQKLEFNAFGLFKYDCKILKEVLGSITVYMLFFIQFLPNGYTEGGNQSKSADEGDPLAFE